MFRFLLYPFSLLYGLGVYIRNRLFDYDVLKSRYFNMPVISVGNITVGGTGKTPHVEYLVKLLKDQNKVAVLSRGYKRKTKGFVVADQSPSSTEVGDEPAQIKIKYPDVEVAVNEKRVDGIEQLIERQNEVIILDDAYQHRHVKPGLSILLIDFNRRIDQDYLLPVGNLRENPGGIRRADIILVTKSPSDIKPIDRRMIKERVEPYPYQELYFTCFKYGKLTPVFDKKVSVPADFHTSHEIYTIILVTGIAFSKPIEDYLGNLSQDIKHIKYPDHSGYNQAKLKKIESVFRAVDNDKKIILTTEKDAIKLFEIEEVSEELKRNMFYIPIEIGFIDKEEEFNEQIFDYVRKNKRNN